jgi:hypothetical protein
VLAKAKALSQGQQWRLAEILDPDTFTHYEFFLTKGKVSKKDWTAVSEQELHQAFAIRQVWPPEHPFARCALLQRLPKFSSKARLA